jgi:hypothetical protein
MSSCRLSVRSALQEVGIFHVRSSLLFFCTIAACVLELSETITQLRRLLFSICSILMNEASEEEVMMFALCMVVLRKFVSPTRKRENITTESL